MSTDEAVIAFIDESVREGPRGFHYLLAAAVLLDATTTDLAKKAAAQVVCGRSRPFRWSREGREKKDAMLRVLSELGCGVVATIHAPLPAVRQGEARSVSLTALLGALVLEGVQEVVIESRGPQDQLDRQTIIEATHAGVVPEELRYRFSGKSEQLLWLADAAVGILADGQVSKDTYRLIALQSRATLLEVQHVGE